VSDRAGIANGLGRIPSGLFVLTAGRGDEATGMLVSFVQQIGFEPPAVIAAVRKGRPIEALIAREKLFCIAILGDGDRRLLAHFARGFDAGEPAFTGLTMTHTSEGIPYPSGTHGHLVCRLLGAASDWSDHTVFCGEVLNGSGLLDALPLVHVRKNGFSY
jgi:flavin reductase (DIM6/NTAB) family NADH-FMN oxidoreductase RutF